MDPAQVFTGEEGTFASLIFNGLLDFNIENQLVPGLAESLPTVSEDKLTYRFRIRPGVRFSNGRALEMSDVIGSFERILDPATQSIFGGYLRSIRGAAAFQEARKRELESRGSGIPRGGGDGSNRWVSMD